MANKKGRSGNPAKRAAGDAAAARKVGADEGTFGTNEPGVAESGDNVAIYHEMRAEEGFDDTAEMIFQLVRDCAATHPGKSRLLFLDVAGHRNQAGGFDQDAYELIVHFVTGFLMQWLTEAGTPFGIFRNANQREDVPDALDILPGGDSTEREETLRKNAKAMGSPIYDSETGEMVDTDGARRPARG
jgi:hypothetical protein